MVEENFEVLRGDEVEFPIVASSHHMHSSSRGIDPRGTGHGYLQHGSRRGIGIYSHRLSVPHKSPVQDSESKFN
jgi:hypothetical protein